MIKSLSELENSIVDADNMADSYYKTLSKEFAKIYMNRVGTLDLQALHNILKDAKIGCQQVQISQSFIADCKSEMKRSWVKKKLEKKLKNIKLALYSIPLLKRKPEVLNNEEEDLYKALSANRSSARICKRGQKTIIKKYKEILDGIIETSQNNTPPTLIPKQ